MTLDLPALEAAAKAATPGPWAYRMGDIVQLTDSGQGYPLDYYPDCEDVVGRDQDGDRILADRNAEFIAIANPATVLALVERIRALETGLRWACDMATQFLANEGLEDSDKAAPIAALRELVP